MWSSRDVTIFGRAMLIKTLGISQSGISRPLIWMLPKELWKLQEQNFFKFLWRNKKDKMKRLDAD